MLENKATLLPYHFINGSCDNKARADIRQMRKLSAAAATPDNGVGPARVTVAWQSGYMLVLRQAADKPSQLKLKY